MIFKILFVFFWAIISVSLFLSNRKMKSCINTSHISNQKIFGVVAKKEENNWNHATEIAYFTNGNKFVWSDDIWTVSGFFKDIELGDSLVKKKGSYVIEIHKKDTVIYFDMLKNCSDYDENKEYN